MKAGKLFFLFWMLWACNSPVPTRTAESSGDGSNQETGGTANTASPHTTAGASGTTVGSGGTRVNGGTSAISGTSTYSLPSISGLPAPDPDYQVHQCCIHSGNFGIDYNASCDCIMVSGVPGDVCPADYPTSTCQGHGSCQTKGSSPYHYADCCTQQLQAGPWHVGSESWGIIAGDCYCRNSVSCLDPEKLDFSWVYTLPTDWTSAIDMVPSEWLVGRLTRVSFCGDTPMGPEVGGAICPWS